MPTVSPPADVSTFTPRSKVRSIGTEAKPVTPVGGVVRSWGLQTE